MKLFLATTFLCLFVMNAHSQVRHPLNLIGLPGHCLALEAFGMRAVCKDQLLNTNFNDGRLDFTYVAISSTGDTLIAFSGDGSRQIKIDADTVSQPIDVVFVSSNRRSIPHKASGECNYGNPVKGPAIVRCNAETEEGRFSGLFQSDGKPPVVTKFGN